MNRGTVLVTGANGYVGGRLVPRLLAEGWTVRAAFTDTSRSQRMPWVGDVQVVEMDATDEAQVRPAVRHVDAVVYLVHGMGRGADFADTDRRAARHMADAVDAEGVGRVVYVSGLVPRSGRADLSEHLRSRVEVERVLGASAARVVTLRAAVVLGSGSTSFEVIRQISERLPVQAVPTWMFSKVQPVAAVDLLEALVGALVADVPTRSYDVGGPDRLSYPRLLDSYARIAGLVRAQVPVPFAPADVAAALAGALTDVPASTVQALVGSLRHDMVCRENDVVRDLLPPGHRLLGLEESIRRSLAPRTAGAGSALDPMAAMPHDPDWAGGGRTGVFAGAARLVRLSRAVAGVVEVGRPGVHTPSARDRGAGDVSRPSHTDGAAAVDSAGSVDAVRDAGSLAGDRDVVDGARAGAVRARVGRAERA